jgi:uncharacterized protein with PQ loop repeat
MDSWIALFSWIFLVTNIGRIFAYLPQIHAALSCENGAKSISRFTWGYFALSHATVSMYGFFVLHDPSMGAIFLGNCIACCTLVAIVTWKQSGLSFFQEKRRSVSNPAAGLLPIEIMRNSENS